jgi:hypothetical protein
MTNFWQVEKRRAQIRRAVPHSSGMSTFTSSTRQVASLLKAVDLQISAIARCPYADCPYTLLWSCELLVVGSTFMMKFRNVLNSMPCNGFKMKSAIISPVGQYSTETSFAVMLSVMKMYWNVLVCWLRLPLDARPCSSRRMELWLSW